MWQWLTFPWRLKADEISVTNTVNQEEKYKDIQDVLVCITW
jgi:hypothetical protein